MEIILLTHNMGFHCGNNCVLTHNILIQYENNLTFTQHNSTLETIVLTYNIQGNSIIPMMHATANKAMPATRQKHSRKLGCIVRV